MNIFVTVVVLLGTVGIAPSMAWSQDSDAPPCTGVPHASNSLTPTIVPAPGPEFPDAPPGPATLYVVWAGSQVDPPPAYDAPTRYLVEVASEEAFLGWETGIVQAPAVTFEWPIVDGDYWVRIRAENACGLSDPSPVVPVAVADGAPADMPAPVLLLDTATATEDVFGDAFVMGRVTNAIGAAHATFVEISATFRGLAETFLGSDDTYVNGHARRLSSSRLITETAIGSLQTGCFRMFTDIAFNDVETIEFTVNYRAWETEPLLGRVVVDGPVLTDADFFGDLRTSGQLTNQGDRLTYFNQVLFDVADADGRVIDCDFTYVDGATVVLESGISTDTGLYAGQSGPFDNFHRPPVSDVADIRTWTVWDEDEEDEDEEDSGASTGFDEAVAAFGAVNPRALTDRERQAFVDRMRRHAESAEAAQH